MLLFVYKSPLTGAQKGAPGDFRMLARGAVTEHGLQDRMPRRIVPVGFPSMEKPILR